MGVTDSVRDTTAVSTHEKHFQEFYDRDSSRKQKQTDFFPSLKGRQRYGNALDEIAFLMMQAQELRRRENNLENAIDDKNKFNFLVWMA